MSFSVDIKKFKERVERNHNRVFRASALEIFKTVITRTPVDTGRLINNWFVSIGGMVKGETGETSKIGADSLAEAVRETARVKNGETIYMTNNLKYAQKIENGGSKDTRPHGMVKSTVLEWEHKVAEKARANK